jgi:two-component system chemotaxis sensor kinase CheA
VNPLLEQFISESRESLQGIAEKLMQLEIEPDSRELMTELFRFVHTLKGNSGLFDFPELTRVLHAGEDLMDAVRDGRVPYSLPMADMLLDAMDFVGMLCDEIEVSDCYDAAFAADSVRLAETLRRMLGAATVAEVPPETVAQTVSGPAANAEDLLLLSGIPEGIRMDAYRAAVGGDGLYLLAYSPTEDCFFQGDDPFFQARQTPGILWGAIKARRAWPKLAELDAYRCALDFHVLAAAPAGELGEYYRYVTDQLKTTAVSPQSLIQPQGDPNGGPVYEDFVIDALGLLRDGNIKGLVLAAGSMLELSNRELWLSSALRWLLLAAELEPENHAVLEAIIVSLTTLTMPDWGGLVVALPSGPATAETSTSAALTGTGGERAQVSPEVRAAAEAIIAAQREILCLPDEVPGIAGRLKAVGASLDGCLRGLGALDALPGLQAATESASRLLCAAPLLSFVDAYAALAAAGRQPEPEPAVAASQSEYSVPALKNLVPEAACPVTVLPADGEAKFGRRSEDAYTAAKSIKVDQAKIDLLMNLIGEMVVAKNALPYLAGRAETVFGVPEFSREIKAQYAVINRIAEEMQDSIMQVRMMPVSFVFQRFPRLVRDTSNKLGKEVNLVLEGEETEADKNIIESLGDPLMHIVRNSLDHGIEAPQIRIAAGKLAAGTLVIRASQEADRVVIEIRDDGKGIDPEVIKRKAYEKGLIDEDRLERISDQEAVNLVFAPGFSTAEAISDLSGRGVGMDVVRTAIEKVHGTVLLESEKGQGTRLRISLPLSMAVTNVMIVESNGQSFGVPMDAVVETVRVPRSAIKTIKKSLATVLRGRIVPLKALNALLGTAAEQRANDEDELAVLVVAVGDASIGILVDDFHETVDIILKPMTGVLAGLAAYAGSALLGDGSVLMVLNIKEVV